MRTINNDTKLVTLIGNPLGFSFSVRMQNKAYEAANMNMLYFNTEAEPEGVGPVVSGIRHMNFAGFAVTKPYKVEILRHLDKLDPFCEKMGSCNTVVKDADGKLTGYNTDGIGFYTSLSGQGVSAKGNTFFCIGAGGAGRAVCSILADKGADKLYVLDIIDERAKDLVDDLNKNFRPDVAEFVPYGDYSVSGKATVVMNASGVGMEETIGQTPFPKSEIRAEQFYYDTCYNPDKTQFLLDAEAAGCRILNGLGMLVHQGAAQVELWSGEKVPVEVMEQEIMDIIAGK